MTIVNGSDIFGKFFDVKFSILANVKPQMALSVIYQTFVTETKHLLGTYAAVNQVTFHSKEIIHIFITYCDLVCSFCRDLSQSNLANMQ